MNNINETLTHLSNKEIEYELLGAVILDPKAIRSIYVKEEVFSSPINQYILYIMRKIDNEGLVVDVSTILNFASQENKVDSEQFRELVIYLSSTAVTAHNVAYKQQQLLDLYMKREQVKMAHEVIQGALNKSYTEIDNMIKEKSSLIEQSVIDKEEGHISEVMQKVIQDLEVERGSTEGSPTHLRDLDKIMNGLKKQEVIVIGASPSVGKTVLAMNIAENHAILNKGISVVFSIEMSDLSVGKRLLSSNTHIHSDKIRNAMEKFDDNDWVKTMKSVGSISETKMHLFDNSNVNMDYIRRKSRMIKEKYRDTNEHMVILIDYLGLIKGSGEYKGNKRLEIGEIAVQLKALSKELDCTVIVLSQLSRDNEKDKRKPIMADLKESGDIEAVADTIILLYREDYQGRETQKKNIIELIVAKNRNGGVGVAEMTFLKHLSKFVNIG